MSSWTTLAVLAAPLLWRHASPLIQSFTTRRTRSSPDQPKEPREALPQWFRPLRLVLLTFSVVFNLMQATVNRPRSLFSQLELPFGAPSSTIWDRLILKEGYNPDFVPPLQAQLLLRLKTYEGRLSYMHFGDAMATCEVCHLSDTELLLAQLPKMVGRYAAMGALFGWLTLGRGRELWRVYLGLLLVAGFAAELYANIQSWDKEVFVSPDRGGECDPPPQVESRLMLTLKLRFVQLPEKLEVARHGAFAFLSLLAFVLPAPAPKPSVANFVNPSLDRLSSQVNDVQSNLATVGIERTAIMRDPGLRSKLQQFWSVAQREGDMASQDVELQRLAREMGLHAAAVKVDGPDGETVEEEEEGQERLEARAFAESTVERLLRSMAPPAGTASASS